MIRLESLTYCVRPFLLLCDKQLQPLERPVPSSLQYMGLTLDQYKAQMRESATKRIKLNLGLEAVAKVEKVEVTDEEIDAKIKELAAQYGSGNDESLLKNENARAYMKQQLQNEKLIKVITDNVVEK